MGVITVLRSAAPRGLHARGLGNQIAVTLIIGGALILSPFARYVLPPRFLLDDGHLQDSMDRHIIRDSESFLLTADIYAAVGLAGRPALAAMVTVGLFAASALLAIGWDRLRDQTLIGLAAIGVSFVLALAYMAQYTKEFVTLMVGLLVLILPEGRRWDGAAAAVCLIYAATIRPYWAIIAVAFLVWRVALARLRHPLWLLIIPLIMYSALTPAFESILGYGIQGAREWSNGERTGTGTQVSTLIESPIPGATGVLGVLSAMIMLALLIVPVPLLASGTPYHMASGALILGIWAVVLWPIVRGELSVRPAVVNTRTARAAALLLALVFTQSLFEPDYGSYLKHLTPLLPLALTLLPAASRVTEREPAAPTRTEAEHPYDHALAGAIPGSPPRPRGRRRADLSTPPSDPAPSTPPPPGGTP